MTVGTTYEMQPIGVVHSCFKEKFTIPRQPRLAPSATAVIELFEPWNDPLVIEGLAGTSHVWVQFVFHQNRAHKPALQVRPPRLGGNKKVGVLATRSPNRPNNLGLSVVKLDAVTPGLLHISGVDLLDQTPVLDIKPYVGWVDAVEQSCASQSPQAPAVINVLFTAPSVAFCQNYQAETGHALASLIEEVLKQDPKPAYQTPSPERIYGTQLWDVNVRWRYLDAQTIELVSLDRTTPTPV